MTPDPHFAQPEGEHEQSNWPGQRHIVASPQVLIEDVAERLVEAAREAISARGVFTLALSGGSSPKNLYKLLASEAYRDRFEWPKIVIVFGDERAVGPDDERSNFRMASEALLAHVPLDSRNVHRMHGEAEDLNEAAKEYGLLIQDLGTSLDVCLLGMGPDGHTASLFPHSPQILERHHRCVATPPASLEPYIPRLTLTYRVFDAARHVWILADGAGKAARLVPST
jgi:6-phosphogluconolactonase